MSRRAGGRGTKLNNDLIEADYTLFFTRTISSNLPKYDMKNKQEQLSLASDTNATASSY